MHKGKPTLIESSFWPLSVSTPWTFPTYTQTPASPSTLPEGATGATGATGAGVATGEVGAVGVTGADTGPSTGADVVTGVGDGPLPASICAKSRYAAFANSVRLKACKGRKRYLHHACRACRSYWVGLLPPQMSRKKDLSFLRHCV